MMTRAVLSRFSPDATRLTSSSRSGAIFDRFAELCDCGPLLFFPWSALTPMGIRGAKNKAIRDSANCFLRVSFSLIDLVSPKLVSATPQTGGTLFWQWLCRRLDEQKHQ